MVRWRVGGWATFSSSLLALPYKRAYHDLTWVRTVTLHAYPVFWIAKSVSTSLGLGSGISSTRHFIDGVDVVDGTGPRGPSS